MKLPFAESCLVWFAEPGLVRGYGRTLRGTLDKAATYDFIIMAKVMTPPLRFHYGTALGGHVNSAAEWLPLSFFSAFKEGV